MVLTAIAGTYFAALFIFFSTISRFKVKRPRPEGAIAAARGLTATLSSMLLSASAARLYRERLLRAGQPRDMDVDGLMAVKIFLGAVGVLVGALFVAGGGGRLGARLTIGAILAVGMFFLPDLWLTKLIADRRDRIQSDLPDFLDMMTVSVEAGLGFDAALSKVAQNSTGPLSEEFFRLLREVQLGSTRKKALRSLSERVDVPELRSFVLAILQADTFGVSVAKVLRTQAKEMRVKRSQRAEEAAMKAPVKIVFPLVLCILPALFIVILGPAGIRMYQGLFLGS